jgi:hypothetical protein
MTAELVVMPEANIPEMTGGTALMYSYAPTSVPLPCGLVDPAKSMGTAARFTPTSIAGDPARRWKS